MPATSEYQAFRRFAVTRMTGDDPLGAGATRDAVVNNLLHLYDSSPQWLVNYVAHDADSRLSQSHGAAGTYVIHWPGQAFVCAVRSDGRPFPFVIRIGGSVSSALYTATFRVVVRGTDEPVSAEGGAAELEAISSSTTDAWLAIDVVEATRVFSEPVRTEETDGGPSGSATTYVMRADVFSQVTNVAAVSRLTGLQIRQYIGA